METIKSKVLEIYKIISKMPEEMCLVAVLPEFGLQWRNMSKVFRKNRLPVTPESIARVLCRHIEATMTGEELDEIVSKLRLKLVAVQDKTWHVFKLLSPFYDEPLEEIMNKLPDRIEAAIRVKLKSKTPAIETTLLGDLMYVSVQINSSTSKGTVQYFATPPGEPVLLACSAGASAALKACVQGLGYRDCEYAMLYGSNIRSLLRISNSVWTAEAEHLSSRPQFDPKPIITKNGIDYTGQSYKIDYVNNIMGQNPPLLNELTISSRKQFYDPNVFNKQFNLKVHIKTDNLAESLKSWAVSDALEPNSELLTIFHTCKSNCIEYTRDDSD